MYEVTLKAGFESMSLHLTPDPLAVIEATYKAEAHAEVGAFRGHSAPDEISRRRLLAFEKQLRDIGGSLTDVAELSGQAFKVRLILDGTGHVAVSGMVRATGCELNFSFEVDQTYLAEFAQAVSAVLREATEADGT